MASPVEERQTGPRLSVCIPAARASTLEHAIRSVLRQDFQDWELFVVGQGANDGPLREMTTRVADGDTSGPVYGHSGDAGNARRPCDRRDAGKSV